MKGKRSPNAESDNILASRSKEKTAKQDHEGNFLHDRTLQDKGERKILTHEPQQKGKSTLKEREKKKGVTWEGEK